ncbi:MAG: AMP-binding protein [candidate division NC10 bacterium]|nr:AMP-binding protein [candidate division NC10 bacterium]MBI2456269.1 AMP-binding protein [candidate division NC10 bacterium]MBI2918147.1 AMP-binding protein [Chloroflexota bacterium]
MPRAGRPPEVEVTPELTIPKLFVRTAREYGQRVAIREKEFGMWRPITWAAYLENVRLFALGLTALGLQRDDKVAMIGDNRPEGLFAEMAALCAGGVAVWLFQDALLEEVQYIVDHCDARFLVAEGQEEVDKALAIKARCPKLERIIWDDPKGMRGYQDPALVPFTEVQRLGRDLAAREPGRLDGLVEEGRGDDVCLLFYTSGTTAKPKGALLTHTNMLKMGQNLMRVDPYQESDDFVSFLPMAWIGEQMMSISCGLMAGFTLNFPEEPETVLDNLREIGPHTIFSSARFYEQMVRTVQVKYLDASRLKRKAYELAHDIGYRQAECKFAKRPVPWSLRALGFLADQVVHKKLRDHLGLSHIRNAYSGGSALGPDYFRFFHAIGVNLKQIYGQTEIAGISVVHRSDDIKFDTVGKPIPETEVRITPEGEIVSRSPSVFKGYYKDPAETAKALRDGWLYSGDTGFLDPDGHLVFFDRTKDVFSLSDGSRFSPMFLESRLKFSPYVKDAWVLGHQRPFAAAVICIDGSVVGKWAEDQHIAYTSYSELSQDPRVYELIQSEIRQVNGRLPAAARVGRFLNLHKEFDADDEELTRTRKLRRAFLEERYQDLVQAIYDGAERVAVGTTITYEDGRVAQVKADLRIADVPNTGAGE